jgi:hypothetical protein
MEEKGAGCPMHLTDEFFKEPLVSLYRFHEKDPVYFRKSLKATMQQIGYKGGTGLFERSDDWCSVALRTRPSRSSRCRRCRTARPGWPT